MTSKYWSEVVRELEPYTPGEQPQVPGLVKLNTNENPYPPSPLVKKALAADDIDRLRLYPDPSARKLRDTLAQYHGVRSEQVFVGNGSDDVLAQIFMAFFQQPRPILVPDITYSFYQVYCQLFGITADVVSLGADLSLDLTRFCSPNGGIIFPNPNAPTGMGLPLSDIVRLLKANTESVVVVDEAYVDFGAETAIPLVAQFANLVVVQTLSKSRALAGMRVGYAIANEALIEGLERVKNSYNSYPLGRLSQLAAIASIGDEGYFTTTCQKIIATREQTAESLRQLGFVVLPSVANFLFVRPPEGLTAAALFASLRANKILVRYFSKPRLDQYVRISIGTDAHMTALLDVLATIRQ